MKVEAGRGSALLEGEHDAFAHHDLGQRSGGEIVEISLSGSAANVRLMDGSNLSSYRNGRQHRYIGGLATSQPIRLQIPSSGHVHVAVDMRGLRGTVRSSARILPGALPAFLRSRCRVCRPGMARGGPSMMPSSSNTTCSFRTPRKTRMRSSAPWPMHCKLKDCGSGTTISRCASAIACAARSIRAWPTAASGWLFYRRPSLRRAGRTMSWTALHQAVTGEQAASHLAQVVEAGALLRSAHRWPTRFAQHGTHTVYEIAKEIADLIRGDR